MVGRSGGGYPDLLVYTSFCFALGVRKGVDWRIEPRWTVCEMERNREVHSEIETGKALDRDRVTWKRV